MHGVERVLHGLATGMLRVPAGVDAGDFVLSGGTIEAPRRSRRRVPSLRTLVEDYLSAQTHKAESTVYTEGVHLRTLLKALEPQADRPADRIVRRDLEQVIQRRLKDRSPTTVSKERETIVQLFRWAVAQGHLDDSPASDLTPIKREVELPPFRTTGEIEAILRTAESITSRSAVRAV